MSVSMAGSAQNVQQALNSVRQTIQTDQVVAAAVVEAANQAQQQAVQEPVEVTPQDEHRGQNVDVKA